MTLLLMRLAFSLLFGATGLYIAKNARDVFVARRNILENGVVTEGEIVDFEVSKSVNQRFQNEYFAPVVTFKAPWGETRRFTSGRALRPNPYVVGQKVPVRYLKDDVTMVDLDAATSSWLPFVVLVVMASVALLVASLPFLLGPPGTD